MRKLLIAALLAIAGPSQAQFSGAGPAIGTTAGTVRDGLLAVTAEAAAQATANAALALTRAPPPVAGMVQTFSYLPSRDGLALVPGGPTDAGYAAKVDSAHIWQPRYIPQGTAATGGSDVYSGNYQLNADPAFAWSNGYSPFAIVGGNLRIRAQTAASVSPAFSAGELPTNPATSAPYSYVSGLLSSKNAFSQQGGYVDVLAQVPKGYAVWSAFWLMPLVETHPPEIDVLETVGGLDPATVYRATTHGISVNPGASVNAGVDLSLAFHRYGVAWNASAITYYLDGMAVSTASLTAAPEFAEPFYILLNQQIGSTLSAWVPPPNGTTPPISDMLIAEVRAFQVVGPIALDVSTSSYLDTVAVGGTVATLTARNFGTSGGNTFTKVSDPDNVFAVSGASLTLTQQIPASTKATHQVTLQATDTLGRTYQRLFTFKVYPGALPVQANYIVSQNLTSGWSLVNATVTSTDILTETTANGTHGAYAASAIVRAAGTRTLQFFADVVMTGRPEMHVQMFDGSYGSSVQAWFNIATGSTGAVSANGWPSPTPFLIQLPNGKTRIGFTVTTDATSTNLQVAFYDAIAEFNDSFVGVTSNSYQVDNIWIFNPNAAAGAK